EGVGDRNLRVVSAKVGGSELVTSDFVVLFEGAPAAKARAGEIPSDSFLAVASEPAGGWVVERLCDEQVAVTGYVNGALEPSIEQQKVLAPLLSQALAGECDLSALGYADTGGPDDLNRTVSEARAQAVAKYLADKGAKFRSTFVVGKGETTEFGPSNSANRRVVVSLK
ncbi:MAG: OmpA family protein, partial [Devosia sp.]